MERRQDILVILIKTTELGKAGVRKNKEQENEDRRVRAVMNPRENQFNVREAGVWTTPCSDGQISAPCGFDQLHGHKPSLA